MIKFYKLLVLVAILSVSQSIQAESELRYNLSKTAKLDFFEENNSSDKLRFNGEKQSFSYINYEWSPYLGIGIDTGLLKVRDNSGLNEIGNDYELELDSTKTNILLNLFMPIGNWISIDIFGGYGYFYTKAIIYKNESNGAITRYKYEDDGLNQTYGGVIKISLYRGVFFGVGTFKDDIILNKTGISNEGAIKPKILGVASNYFLIGYRFGQNSETTSFRPNSGKLNYNNSCMLFNACD